MLELKHIKKTYVIGEIETKALDDVSVSFREKEFVAILGASGSGKTTCLNVIGGLDRYDSGELIIKGKKTSDFKDREWDAYRNNSIGFVFQSYNLIMHLSIVANVELGMTLSGVSSEEKHRRALEVLREVGLGDHLHKKPNQLSGGQMQRVAIARALANDPEILLCDEPTGALDTVTSVQIMDLIKEVAKDRLVIVVTHNPELAERYADRVLNFKDGQLVVDTNPYEDRPKEDAFKLKKTSMNFFTALKLSFNNIRTKKGRTFLTAFASSIGIIGIAVILSLSSGFDKQIAKFQEDALSEFPIIITQVAAQMNMEDMENLREEMQARRKGTDEFKETDKVYLYDPADSMFLHQNEFTEEYIDYLNQISPDICSSIGYTRIVSMNMLRKVNGTVKPASFSRSNTSGAGISSMNGVGLSSYPEQLKQGEETYLVKNYDLLSGEFPKEVTDMVLVIDQRNRINYNILRALGFETENVETIDLSKIVGTEFRLISNDDYYVKSNFGNYIPNMKYDEMYESEDNLTLKISGVVRIKEDVEIGLLGTGIAYSDDLSQLVIDRAMDSQIVKDQRNSNKNVMTMEDFEEGDKDTFLSVLGGNATPYMAMVFPVDFGAKEQVLEYLDAYNKDKEIEDQLIYTDLAGSMSELTSGIMDGITIVLVAFAAISLVVSLIMICIITYTSVLERTKEIGILRALGARKKDITRVFDAETCILGIFSGVLGIFIAWLLTFPINSILYSMTELTNVAQLQIDHGILLVIVSTILTMIGGYIPAKMASRKDAVDALRSE